MFPDCIFSDTDISRVTTLNHTLLSENGYSYRKQKFFFFFLKHFSHRQSLVLENFSLREKQIKDLAEYFLPVLTFQNVNWTNFYTNWKVQIVKIVLRLLKHIALCQSVHFWLEKRKISIWKFWNFDFSSKLRIRFF